MMLFTGLAPWMLAGRDTGSIKPAAARPARQGPAQLAAVPRQFGAEACLPSPGRRPARRIDGPRARDRTPKRTARPPACRFPWHLPQDDDPAAPFVARRLRQMPLCEKHRLWGLRRTKLRSLARKPGWSHATLWKCSRTSARDATGQRLFSRHSNRFQQDTADPRKGPVAGCR